MKNTPIFQIQRKQILLNRGSKIDHNICREEIIVYERGTGTVQQHQYTRVVYNTKCCTKPLHAEGMEIHLS